MMIGNMEYKNIFKPIYFIGGTRKCFICQEIVIGDRGFYSFNNIYLYSDQEKWRETTYYICNNCIETPEKAEEVMIPLLKIMYGRELRIDRYFKKLDGTRIFKSFFY